MPVGDYTINASSLPDYDDWGYDTYWGCQHWIQWHQALVDSYGNEQANAMFMNAWDQTGVMSANLDCRTFNTDFRNYFREQGLLDAIYGSAGIMSAPLQLAGATGDFFTGIAGGIGTTGRVIGRILWVIPVLLIIWFGYKIFQKQS